MKRMFWFPCWVALLCFGVSTRAFSASSLAMNGTLRVGQQLTNGSYRLIMQSDGNLVIYGASNAPLWATGTDGKGGTRLILQTDSNLVMYTGSNRRGLGQWNRRYPCSLCAMWSAGRMTASLPG